MPFLFPIAGLIISGSGLAMIIKYIQSDQETRSRLDEWATKAAKMAIRAFIKLRYGVDLGGLTPEEEKEYWREFGIRLDDFLTLAEPIAMELFGKPFVMLNREEQAMVARRVVELSGESAE